MGNFFDDLTRTISDLIYTPPSDSSYSNLNLDGIKVSNSEMPMIDYAPIRAPNHEQQSAIIQKRENPFNTFDVNPASYSSFKYVTGIPIGKIIDKVGYDFDLVPGPSTTSYNAWRTVELNSVGTFLKINFLPSPLNSTVDRAGSVDPNTYGKYDQNGVFQIQIDDGGVKPQPLGSKIYDTSRQLLIQFNDIGNPLILVNDGDSIDCTFNKVYVTFKYFVPRFTVVTGFNSKISSTENNAQRNMDLALGPGYGLWDNPQRHCVPWSTTNSGDRPAGAAVNYTSAQLVTNYVIFDPANALAPQNAPQGTMTGWITGVSISAGNSTLNSNAAVDFNIFIMDGGTNALRQILNIPMLFFPINATSNSTPIFYNLDFSTPLRFSLQNDGPLTQGNVTRVRARSLVAQVALAAGSAGTVSLKWSIRGYTYGAINFFNLTNVDQTTGNTRWGGESLVYQPFPNDDQTD